VVLAEIWGPGRDGGPIPTELLRALAHAGNYVVLARDREGPVGACVGFLGAPSGETLHSHVAAVSPRVRGAGVGHAIKLHQRAWAAERGIARITWTFDPLIRRNAYFNLTKLGARAQEYLVDFYGSLVDVVNDGQGSDRLLVSWDVVGRPAPDDPPANPVDVLVVGPDDRPLVHSVPTDAPALRIQIPSDVEALRRIRPDLAHEWRAVVRQVFATELADGARVTGFDRSGFYLVERRSQ
jgi:predicted GNAT superfamily acetyltransferase